MVLKGHTLPLLPRGLRSMDFDRVNGGKSRNGDGLINYGTRSGNCASIKAHLPTFHAPLVRNKHKSRTFKLFIIYCIQS